MIPPTFHIGDLVEIVGPDWHDNHDEVGKLFKIESYHAEYGWYSAFGRNFYPAASLRKLTPEEIKQHQAAQMLPKSTEIQELRRRIHDLEMSLNGFTNGPEPEHVPGISYVKDPIGDRLSAIEKQLKEQHEKINQFDGEISHLLGSIQECLMESGDVEARTRCREMTIEKRLDFVEQFQRDQTRDALCKDWSA